jgi:hypothetical protein
MPSKENPSWFIITCKPPSIPSTTQVVIGEKTSEIQIASQGSEKEAQS